MTPAQCRAARALLDWSQQALAEVSGVGNATIRNIEAGRSEPTRSTLEALRRALEAAGVIFVEENGEGPGVRLRKDPAKLETAIKASEDALAGMDKTPSPKRALHEMKAAIAKDGRRVKGASET